MPEEVKVDNKTEEKSEPKKSVMIGGIEFRLPFKMAKSRFKELYGERFKDNTDTFFEKLKAEK